MRYLLSSFFLFLTFTVYADGYTYSPAPPCEHDVTTTIPGHGDNYKKCNYFYRCSDDYCAGCNICAKGYCNKPGIFTDSSMVHAQYRCETHCNSNIPHLLPNCYPSFTTTSNPNYITCPYCKTQRCCLCHPTGCHVCGEDTRTNPNDPIIPVTPPETDTGTNPGGGTDNPGGGTDNPGGGTDNPGGGTDNPGGGTDNPGGGTDNPGGGTDNPGGGTDNPGGGTMEGGEIPGSGSDLSKLENLAERRNDLLTNIKGLEELNRATLVKIDNGIGQVLTVNEDLLSTANLTKEEIEAGFRYFKDGKLTDNISVLVQLMDEEKIIADESLLTLKNIDNTLLRTQDITSEGVSNLESILERSDWISSDVQEINAATLSLAENDLTREEKITTYTAINEGIQSVIGAINNQNTSITIPEEKNRVGTGTNSGKYEYKKGDFSDSSLGEGGEDASVSVNVEGVQRYFFDKIEGIDPNGGDWIFTLPLSILPSPCNFEDVTINVNEDLGDVANAIRNTFLVIVYIFGVYVSFLIIKKAFIK